MAASLTFPQWFLETDDFSLWKQIGHQENLQSDIEILRFLLKCYSSHVGKTSSNGLRQSCATPLSSSGLCQSCATPLSSSGLSQSCGPPLSSSGLSQLSAAPLSSSGLSQSCGPPLSSSGLSQLSAAPLSSSGLSQSCGPPLSSSGLSQLSAAPLSSSGLSQLSAAPLSSSGLSQLSAAPLSSSGLSQLSTAPLSSSGLGQSCGPPLSSSGLCQSCAAPLSSSGLSQLSTAPLSSSGLGQSCATPLSSSGLCQSCGAPLQLVCVQCRTLQEAGSDVKESGDNSTALTSTHKQSPHGQTTPSGTHHLPQSDLPLPQSDWPSLEASNKSDGKPDNAMATEAGREQHHHRTRSQTHKRNSPSTVMTEKERELRLYSREIIKEDSNTCTREEVGLQNTKTAKQSRLSNTNRVKLKRGRRPKYGIVSLVCEECSQRLSSRQALISHLYTQHDICVPGSEDLHKAKKRANQNKQKKSHDSVTKSRRSAEVGLDSVHTRRQKFLIEDQHFNCDKNGEFDGVESVENHDRKEVKNDTNSDKDNTVLDSFDEDLKNPDSINQSKQDSTKTINQSRKGSAKSPDQSQNNTTKTVSQSKNMSNNVCGRKSKWRDEGRLCEVCGSSFSNRKQLYIHRQNCRSTKCHICGKEVKRIKTHMMRHVEHKRFQCPECPKSFPFRTNLQQHLVYHNDERPHVCEICGMRYREKARLNDHLRTHSGLKPFKCLLCEASFTRSRGLRDHQRVHTGEKPYRCNVCNRPFSSTGNLAAHRRKVHKLAPLPCNHGAAKNSLWSRMQSRVKESPVGRENDVVTSENLVLDSSLKNQHYSNVSLVNSSSFVSLNMGNNCVPFVDAGATKPDSYSPSPFLKQPTVDGSCLNSSAIGSDQSAENSSLAFDQSCVVRYQCSTEGESRYGYEVQRNFPPRGSEQGLTLSQHYPPCSEQTL